MSCKIAVLEIVFKDSDKQIVSVGYVVTKAGGIFETNLLSSGFVLIKNFRDLQ